jgi:hypothetical protein
VIFQALALGKIFLEPRWPARGLSTRIGDFIALAAITDIPTLRALWLDQRREKSSIFPAVSASSKTAEFSSNRNAAPTFPTSGDGGH